MPSPAVCYLLGLCGILWNLSSAKPVASVLQSSCTTTIATSQVVDATITSSPSTVLSYICDSLTPNPVASLSSTHILLWFMIDGVFADCSPDSNISHDPNHTTNGNNIINLIRTHKSPGLHSSNNC